MSDIQRYHPADDYIEQDGECLSYCEPNDEGHYVKYDDHIAEVEEVKRKVYEGFMSDLEALQARIAELEEVQEMLLGVIKELSPDTYRGIIL